jgi:hypothetical protein
MKHEEKYTLLTFYKFVEVKNPEAEVLDHLVFTKDI